MAKNEYEIGDFDLNVKSEYSGNPFDPAKIHVSKALGSLAAIPPYFRFPKKDQILTTAGDPYQITGQFNAVGLLHSVMPLQMRPDGKSAWFTFPIEPLVSISGKNTIVRRSVAKAKGHGTIKERWSQDDYTVTIQGVIIGRDENSYPKYEVKWLKRLFSHPRSVEVKHEIMLILGITHLAVENITFPHTKGLSNQTFEIKAYSDRSIDLLIPL